MGLRAPSEAHKEPQVKKIVQFFKDSYAELRKVVWPSREDVVASTKVVIVSTVVMAAILGFIDYVLVVGIDVLFR
jgi:preprotein translocase subunit SecE